MNTSGGLVWVGRDPRDKPVQLKQETWEVHARNSSHGWIGNYLGAVTQSLTDPTYITEDAGHPGREHYIDLFRPLESGHIMGLVVVTDVWPDGTRDVVTVMPKRSLRQERGGVLYERPRSTP